MKRRKEILSLLFIGFFVVTLVSFAPLAAAETTDEGQLNKIVVGMFEQPDYLGPMMAGSIAAWEFLNWMYDPLIRWDDDWGIKGGLAESWEWADNGTQLTLHLVHNATWHDGVPFTSKDVNWTLFTWTWLGWWVAQTPRIDHRNIRCPDDYTVVLNFVESGYEDIAAWQAAPPYWYWRASYDNTSVEVNKEAFLTGLTYVPILPAHKWDPLMWRHPVWGAPIGPQWTPGGGTGYGVYDENGTWVYYGYWAYYNWDGISWGTILPPYNRSDIGTGPFILKDYVVGEYAVFEGNDNYHWGAPAIDNLTVLFYANIETMTQAVRAGEIDFCETTADFIELLDFGPEVTINEVSSLGWQALLLNQDWVTANVTVHPNVIALSEPAVKEAINQAVNKSKIVSTAYLGHARVADSVIHSELKWFDHALVKRDSGTSEAVATLEADGWVLNAENVYEKNLNGSMKTLSFSILYDSGDPISDKIAQLIKADLEAAGFDITLQKLDFLTYTARLLGYEYELGLGFWSQIGDPNSMAQYMTSTSWINPTGLNVPRVDQIYKEQQLAVDTAREALIDEMQQLIYDEASICVLAEISDIEIYRNDRWEFPADKTVWLSGILSMWNWESWLDATPVPPAAGLPIPMELVAAGVGILVVVVILVYWRSRRG
ncbi:MAG: ABC transporter substrate-binding protein [Candidatus Thorarchaeota archaeon]|nr:MAG: ABC transporter substrate-binding protein [Candidatus Thorarchaeota archaeon]